MGLFPGAWGCGLEQAWSPGSPPPTGPLWSCLAFLGLELRVWQNERGVAVVRRSDVMLGLWLGRAPDFRRKVHQERLSWKKGCPCWLSPSDLLH